MKRDVSKMKVFGTAFFLVTAICPDVTARYKRSDKSRREWCPKTPNERRYVPHQSPPSVPSFIYTYAHTYTRTHIRARESGRTRAWAQANENLSCCRSGECTKPFAQDDAERTIYRSSKYDVWLHPRRPREETPLARSSPR